LSASDIAARVTAGSLTARDVVDDTLSRIARHDAVLAAFTTVRPEAARREADHVQRRVSDGDHLPLAGVPVAIKDNTAVTGEVMRAGSRATLRARRSRSR